MAREPTHQEAWQAEKDLLADGRELLERLCSTTRYRHLYPGGPNTALLLEAYQDLARRRLVRRETRGSRRRDWRRLRRLLKRKVRRDALSRDRRLHFRYPRPRNRRLRTGLPPVLRRALEQVDHDVRDDITRLLRGEERAGFSADRSIASQSRIEASLDRGLLQLREALVNGALADPSSILSLNAQHIAYTESAQPTKARHPIATLVLVKMPLQLMMLIWILFSSAYMGAYLFFNDQVLGRFLTDTLSPILDGELAFESIHWEPLLIVDLITGNPHTLRVEGVRVYEPYKSLGKEKDELAAYAEDLELALTLHEIIPWNRLGVPPVIEIPWVLHFSDVHNHGELWVRAREYQPEGTDRRLIGLVDAFLEPEETPSKAGYRKLSVQLDDADLPGARVILDFREFGGWGTDLSFEQLRGDLDFLGWYPEDARPDPLPLRWSVRGDQADGLIWMLGKELVAEDLSLDDAGSGMRFTPLGDMRVRGEGTVAGSPAKFDGFLRGIYADEKSVSYQVSSTDAHDIVQVFTASENAERPMVAAHDDPARLTIEGPLDDASLRMVAQGITVDLFPDPAWALDDVDVSLVMTRDPVPEMWAEDRPPAAEGDDDERWILYLETLRGAGLDGSLRLHGKGQLDHVVLADDEDDPLLASIHLDLDGVNPAQLVPDDPKLQDFLRGAADGGAELDKLVLSKGGSGGLERLHFFLHRAHLTRDAGPREDGLPRHLWADGDVLHDREQGLDLRGLKLSTEGGYVAGSGGLDPDWKHLEPTSLAVRIDDGAAFSRAFAIDQYFNRLTADLSLSGPLMSPTGRNGSLSISGVGSGDVSLTGVTDAKLWMEAGVLHLRSPNAGLLGGHGPLELDVVLFERGKLLSDPRVRLFVDLEGVDQRNIGGSPIHVEGAELRLYVDDGNGGPIKLSELQARGAAYADSLYLAGERYRNANASFAFTRDGIRIDQLALSYHRPVSPHLGPKVSVEVGTLRAKGTIGFQSDPELDLDLQADGLPLAALTRFIDDELPMRGQLAGGSRIALRGTVSRPEVDGHVELDSLSGFGVPLGRGRLDFETNDVPADAGLAKEPHRAVAIQGRFEDGRRARDGGGLRWNVAATVAFGEAKRKRERPVEIDAGATFESLPVSNLLADPDQSQWRERVDGQLNDLEIRARYCPEGSAMLEACGDREASTPTTRVNIDLAHLWVRPRGTAQSKAAAAAGDPCLDPTTLCSDTPLHSVLEGDLVRLTQPWQLRTGGKARALLSVAGTFDLASAPAAKAASKQATCQPGTTASTPGGAGDAEIAGEFDLAALAAVLQAYDFQPPAGRVRIAMEVDGYAASPRVRGHVKLPPNARELALEIGEELDARGRRKPSTIPIALSDLDLELRESTVYLAGAAKIFDESLRFGTVNGPRSTLTVSGPCRGRYELALDGTLDAALLGVLGGDFVETSSGSADLARLHMAGDLSSYNDALGIGSLMDSLSGEISFKRKAFRVRLPYEAITIVNGKVEFRRCSPERPCTGIPDGSYAFSVGGEQGAGAGSRPRDALSMTIGDRGRADAWGRVYLDERLADVRSASMHASVSQVPYMQSDNAGAPELTAALTSRDIVFERDDLGDMVVRGKVLVEKGRWLRDAQQGVAILSFADPVPAPPEELPEGIRDLRLDLALQTTAPFRIDNNVLKKFEAEGELSLAGTLENPELTGTVTVDRGELDLDILGEVYEVAEGKVRLDRVISSSFVDIVAIGKEPKKIDEQLHYITLRLRGPLDEISWECSALGDVSNELGSTRRCVDYVIFDAGNVDVAEQDVRRMGGSGLLYTGRPLTLVGKLTELELNDYLEDRIPRVERYLPYASVRLGQLGIETEIETRPEWLNWGWGDLGFGFNYLRGYPGSLVRDTRAFTGRLEILDHSAFEFTSGTRNYTNRVLILDPPNYSRLEFLQNWQIPSAR